MPSVPHMATLCPSLFHLNYYYQHIWQKTTRTKNSLSHRKILCTKFKSIHTFTSIYTYAYSSIIQETSIDNLSGKLSCTFFKGMKKRCKELLFSLTIWRRNFESVEERKIIFFISYHLSTNEKFSIINLTFDIENCCKWTGCWSLHHANSKLNQWLHNDYKMTIEKPFIYRNEWAATMYIYLLRYIIFF